MRILWTILVTFLLISSVHGQGPPASPETEYAIADLLIRANTKRILATREIAQSPGLVDEQVDRVLTALDGLFQDQMQERFDAHYEEVEQSLKAVSLDIGKMETAWLSTKAAAWSSGDLDEVIEGFFRQAETATEPQREALIEFLDTRFEDVLVNELEQAQNMIREPFQQIIARHFPVWPADVGNWPAPPPLESSDLQKKDQSLVSGLGSVIGIRSVIGILVGGGLYKLIEKTGISKKIVDKMSKKILGKAGGKAVTSLIAAGATAGAVGGPAGVGVGAGVGAAVAIGGLAYDVVSVVSEKEDLEHELRTQFFTAYKGKFSPATIWSTKTTGEDDPSFRQETTEDVHEFLRGWSRHCREEVERILTSATVFVLSPNIKKYISEQAQNGRNTREIVEDLNLIGSVFKEDMIRRAPAKKLLLMLAHAPDKQELAHLSGKLGSRLLEEYDRHGQEVLEAAHLLGVPTFLEVVHAGRKLDWQAVREVFEGYPNDLSDSARRGLLLALEERTAPSRVASTTLENVARHEQLFRAAAALVRSDELFRLFGNAAVLSIADRVHRKNGELAQAFLNRWTVRTWERYRDADRLGALLNVADYRLGNGKQSVDDFAREMDEHDELTPIFLDVGLCGVQLWDSYVGATAGRHQRQQAEDAIDLYKEGFPCDVLKTPEGLDRVRVYAYIPFGFGPLAFDVLHPLGKLIYAAVIIVVLMFFTIPVVWLWRKLPSKDRSTSPARQPVNRAVSAEENDGTDRSEAHSMIKPEIG